MKDQGSSIKSNGSNADKQKLFALLNQLNDCVEKKKKEKCKPCEDKCDEKCEKCKCPANAKCVVASRKCEGFEVPEVADDVNVVYTKVPDREILEAIPSPGFFTPTPRMVLGTAAAPVDFAFPTFNNYVKLSHDKCLGEVDIIWPVAWMLPVLLDLLAGKVFGVGTVSFTFALNILSKKDLKNPLLLSPTLTSTNIMNGPCICSDELAATFEYVITFQFSGALPALGSLIVAPATMVNGSIEFVTPNDPTTYLFDASFNFYLADYLSPGGAALFSLIFAYLADLVAAGGSVIPPAIAALLPTGTISVLVTPTTITVLNTVLAALGASGVTVADGDIVNVVANPDGTVTLSVYSPAGASSVDLIATATFPISKIPVNAIGFIISIVCGIVTWDTSDL